MKYYSLVSISIPIGMLLSGCGHYAMTTSSVAFERSTSSQPPGTKMAIAFFSPKPTATAVLLPNYVKHNESIKYPIVKNATTPTKAFIEVQLTKPDSTTGQQYIQYRITDTYIPPVIGVVTGGHKGRWHHKDAVTFENKDSDLFSTSFTTLPLVTPFGNEVKISGDDARGGHHEWVSKSENQFSDDVKWVGK